MASDIVNAMRPLFPFVLAVLICTGGAARLPAQTSTAPAEKKEGAKDKPYARIAETGWGPNGELILAVRIHAGTAPAFLGSMGNPDSHSAGGAPKGFSLEDSYLTDARTDQKLLPLAKRPKKPYFGPVSTVIKLAANGWMQLGVAFPHPPSPGKNKEGGMNPYILRFYPPEGLAPVEVEIPFDENAEAAAKRAG